jgi:hypothetical protein
MGPLQLVVAGCSAGSGLVDLGLARVRLHAMGCRQRLSKVAVARPAFAFLTVTAAGTVGHSIQAAVSTSLSTGGPDSDYGPIAEITPTGRAARRRTRKPPYQLRAGGMTGRFSGNESGVCVGWWRGSA